MENKPKRRTWEMWKSSEGRKVILHTEIFKANDPYIDHLEKENESLRARIAELEAKYEPNKENIDDYVRSLAMKYADECEHLTRDQFEVALKQAMESGDFVRATMQEHSPITTHQGVYYIPYNLKTELSSSKETIASLKEALEEIAKDKMLSDKCTTEVTIATMLMEKMGIARTALKEAFGDESDE